jgi:thiamine-phosphate pyrophosphorylase
MTDPTKPRLELPRFYPILDTAALAANGLAPVDAARSLLDGGVRILQYRHKFDFTQAHFDEARQIAKLCATAGALFVMNDRADFALLLAKYGGHCGVHLGQTDLPVLAARKVTGPDIFIGRSTHSALQLQNADPQAADYLALGPIFGTTSKENPDPVVGDKNLATWRALTTKPLVAIGGITPETAQAVLRAGADSLAVISGLFEEPGLNGLKSTAKTWLWVTGS